jgi:hypothetical protein
VLDLRGRDPDARLVPIDLCDIGDLEIYRSTVEEYEGLVKQVFSLLGAQLRGHKLLRKPPRRVPGDPARKPRSEPRESSA